MKSLRNSVRLLGNIGADPEVREVRDVGRHVKRVKFTLATTESYKNQQGEVIRETQWHHIVAWGKVAEIAERYYFKGCQIYLEGKLVNRNYEDKSGVKRFYTEVQAYEMMLVRQPK